MKLLLTSAILCFVFSSAYSQKTYIPDPNFENALIFEGIDDVLDDSVLTSAIDTLTFLDLEPFRITDLTGIEGFTALKTLVVRNNRVQELDLSGNLFLEFLNCENNFMRKLDVSKNGVLKKLFAERNRLTSIDLSQNPLLEIIELNQNGLDTIDLSANPQLKNVQLSNTSLDTIDLSNNPLLEYLDVSTNHLTGIDVTSSPNLSVLVMFGNAITQVNVSNNPRLKTFLGMGNKLTDLNLLNNPLLTYIACYNNELTSLILPPIDSLSGLSYSLGSGNNSNLHCIQCDNPTFMLANWTTVLDSFTVVSNACSTVSNDLELESEMALDIFPNPTLDGLVSIKTAAEGTYRLLDLRGVCMRKSEFRSGTSAVDFTSLKAGVYFLQVELNQRLVTRKIVVH